MAIYDGSLSPIDVIDTIIPSIEFVGTQPDDERHLLFRKNMFEYQEIDLGIYDTESYYLEDKPETDLINRSENDEVYIEILKHNYIKDEYDFEVISHDIPQYNMFWRNAIAFLGRVIVNGDIQYKGLIILQFDGTRHNVILQKPKEVNFGTFSQEDPTSLSYNALDPAPFVFEDLIGDDALAFRFPTILGVIPYNFFFPLRGTGNLREFAKTFSSFDKNQLMYLRPYFAIPEMPFVNMAADNRIFSITLERLMFPEDTPDRYVLSNSVDVNGLPFIDWEANELRDFLYQIYDLSNTHSQVIRFRLVTEILENPTVVVSGGQAANIPIAPSDLKDLSQVLNNMETSAIDTEGDLIYRININSRQDNSTQYSADIKISRDTSFTDITGQKVIQANTIEDRFEWNISDQREVIQRIVNFEGIDFPINLTTGKTNGEYNLISYEQEVLVTVSVDSSNGQHIRHVSTGTTQPILVRGEQLLDPNEMLKRHNLKNATYLAGYDRYLLLYGPYTGSNVLQFLEYDQADYAPYPFGAIDFDYEISHIHVHRGNIYVFTTGGLWILHSIVDYLNLRKTMAYSNLDLNPTEKRTVKSFGNEVFYMHDNRGYVIRTNVNVESQDDVYIIPVTGPVDNILKYPNEYIKMRLQEGYGKIIDAFEDLKVTYYTKASNTELYIYATYYIEDQYNRKENIMVVYIYDKDNRRWKTYDMVRGGYPVEDFTSGNAKGYDLLLINDYKNPYTTYASYLNYLPRNDEDIVIGDVQSVLDGQFIKNERPTNIPTYQTDRISGLLDSGALAFNSQHTKKIRRINTTFLDIKGEGFNFYIVPYVDYLNYQNRIDVEVIRNASNDYIAEFKENINELGISSVLPVISSKTFQQQGFRVSLKDIQSTKKLNLLTQLNMRGKLPGFKMYLFMDDKMKIGDYGIVYRQQKAR